MTLCRPPLVGNFVIARLAFVAATLTLLTCALPALAQSINRPTAGDSSNSTRASYSGSINGFNLPTSATSENYGDDLVDSADAEIAFSGTPEPAASGGGNPEHANVEPAAEWKQPPFSRIGIGADVSPLGIGLKSAIVLNRYFDARFMGNFFGYSSGRFEIDGFNMNANLHMASAAASLDWYPFNSIWRLSPGLLFFNDNQISAVINIAPGTSIDLNSQTFYSATANRATGATPLKGSGVLGLNRNRPAVTMAGGFGKFIPRSNRHWSFPVEFGVAFTGAPSINIKASGWTCLDVEQTQCSNIGSPTNPVAIEFNSALQASLAKWRKNLSRVQVYPLFSYSVVYSFNIR